jgi:hypothetical protein
VNGINVVIEDSNNELFQKLKPKVKRHGYRIKTDSFETTKNFMIQKSDQPALEI